MYVYMCIYVYMYVYMCIYIVVEEELVGIEENREEANDEEAQHGALVAEMLARESVRLEVSIFTFIVS